MARNKAKSNALAQAVQALGTHIKQQGTQFVSAEQTEQFLSFESLSASEVVELEHHQMSLEQMIKDNFSSLNGGLENLTESQIEAGVIAAMAAGNPGAYAQRASVTTNPSMEGITVVEAGQGGEAGTYDYRDQASLEAFDERELRNYIPFSVAYNIQASRQSPFAEQFYPTVVMTPDQNGLDMTVRLCKVFNEVRHAITGKAMKSSRFNLIDALIDPSILASESTSVIPVVLADNSNLDQFVPSSVVAPVTQSIDGIDIQTAPLKIGKVVDLLGISQHPGLIGAGLMDSTDSLDARISLKTLIIAVKTGADVDHIRFDVSRLPRNGFSKTSEGGYREMGLQFRNAELPISPATLDVANLALSSLSVLTAAGWTARLAVEVSGSVDTELGTANFFAPPVQVASLFDAAGNEVSITSGAGATFVGATTYEVVGYEITATRSNINRRTRGLLLTNDEVTERHTIPVGAPISILSAPNSSKDASDLAALIDATRARNTNNAHTTLLNYAASLKAFALTAVAPGSVPSIEGIGRYLVKPFYEEIDLDLSVRVDSIKSHERASDVAAELVNTIRELAYRMNRNSQYQTALESMNGGAAVAPILLIGCDQLLLQHLMISGDTRTAGIGFEYRIVGSADKRMRDKIVMTFTRPGAGGPDPLSFGCHVWVPELATSMVVPRNGANPTEAQVQPRNLHFNNLPVMGMINVIKLKEALTA